MQFSKFKGGFKLCFCIFTNVHNFFLRMIQAVFFFEIYPIIFSVFVAGMLQSKFKTNITRQVNANTFNNKTTDIFYNITIIFIKINVYIIQDYLINLKKILMIDFDRRGGGKNRLKDRLNNRSLGQAREYLLA